MRRVLILAIVAAFTLGSCGQSSIPRATSRELRADVAAIRAAVEDGRIVLAERRLDALATVVGRLLDRGRIDEATAIGILESVDAVRAVLHLAPESSPTTTVTTTPFPSPEDAGDEGDEGDGGKGHGKDKDKGQGDEGHGNDD